MGTVRLLLVDYLQILMTLCCGIGNPIGGLVFSSTFDGKATQIHEWTNFMSAQQFCIRACKDGTNAPALCQHIYDEMGCAWNMPANYDSGVFEKCQGDTGEVRIAI